MKASTVRYIGAGVLALVIGHLSGCTDGFLAEVGRNTSTNTAAPEQVVDVNQARQQLARLVVAPEGSGAGYSRERFPHWSTVEGACDTREAVLAKQGTDVQSGGDCYPDAGTWTSPYDGATWTRASDIDVDHMVALKEAWESGAAGWPEQRREDFANDLGPAGDGYPQLIAVTDNVNQAKGTQDPAEWQPSLTAYRCTYAAHWVAAKATWNLAADAAEVAALGEMLDTCGGSR